MYINIYRYRQIYIEKHLKDFPNDNSDSHVQILYPFNLTIHFPTFKAPNPSTAYFRDTELRTIIRAVPRQGTAMGPITLNLRSRKAGAKFAKSFAIQM